MEDILVLAQTLELSYNCKNTGCTLSIFVGSYESSSRLSSWTNLSKDYSSVLVKSLVIESDFVKFSINEETLKILFLAF